MARTASRGRAGKLSRPREPFESPPRVRAVRRLRRSVEFRAGGRPRRGWLLHGSRDDTDKRPKSRRRRDVDHAAIYDLSLRNVSDRARPGGNRRRSRPAVDRPRVERRPDRGFREFSEWLSVSLASNSFRDTLRDSAKV